MSWVAAPDAPANSANQNGAQPISALAALPPVLLVLSVVAAPLPTSVFRPATVGYPVG